MQLTERQNDNQSAGVAHPSEVVQTHGGQVALLEFWEAKNSAFESGAGLRQHASLQRETTAKIHNKPERG